jgi:hypothetical protein
MSLHEIQRKVRAKKAARNDFGGYNYRNAEGILAELKAALPEGWTVNGTDFIFEIGGRLFLQHQVTLYDAEGKDVATAQGWAMHPDTKKGMDPAQITGSCSTYAKKYALQNLLAIDDGSVDPDAAKEAYEPSPVELSPDLEPNLPDFVKWCRDQHGGGPGFETYVADTFIKLWNKKPSQGQVASAWDKNKDGVAWLERHSRADFDRVVDAYETRIMELSKNFEKAAE